MTNEFTFEQMQLIHFIILFAHRFDSKAGLLDVTEKYGTIKQYKRTVMMKGFTSHRKVYC